MVRNKNRQQNSRKSKNVPRGKKESHKSLEIFELVLDSLYDGAVVTDAEGYILYFNKPYGRFLRVDPEAQIGKHVTDVIENTRMHIVAKTGKPEINRIQRINGHDMVVQRLPVKKDGKVIGVYAQVMFKDIRDVGKLARKLSLLESKVKYYEKELISLRSTRYTLESIIGASDAIASLKEEARRAAATHFPVLISGESGTGKELFAQAIHNASPRKMHPFVRINCSAIPKDLLESELFGYEGGAFTGAKPGGKPGKLELAHYGTLFLDEIGDLPLEMQPKLLRVLDEKEFERLGGNYVIRADFRLIVATNQNLETMLEERRFRSDLFYRLNVIPIPVPPLRERKEDVIPLAEHLLQQISQDFGFPEIKIDHQAEEALMNYDWPGNVRELSNVMERTLSMLEGDIINYCDLPFYLLHKKRLSQQSKRSSLKAVHARTEKEAIHYALEFANYNKARAAKTLGIHRTLLYRKMKKYNIPVDPHPDISR
ncbi:MAG: sigma 54-interacting transcriptional regulator [Desulfobacteraceae bacterium]|nr:sigma 54-interacting transcriptional regulator [Desulfobacteraceae bacterium]